MTLVKTPSYQEMALSRPTKSGIRIISEMSSGRILLFLVNRHRVGLLIFGNLVLGGYLVYDKIYRLFF